MERGFFGQSLIHLTLKTLGFVARHLIRYFANLVKVGLIMLAGLIAATGGLPIIENGDVVAGSFRSIAPPFEMIPVTPQVTEFARGILAVTVGSLAAVLFVPAVGGIGLFAYTLAFAVVATVHGVGMWVFSDFPKAIGQAMASIVREAAPVWEEMREEARREVARQKENFRLDHPRTAERCAMAVQSIAPTVEAVRNQVTGLGKSASFRRTGAHGPQETDGQPLTSARVRTVKPASGDNSTEPANPQRGRTGLQQLWTAALDAVHGPLPPHLQPSGAPKAQNSTAKEGEPSLP